MLADKLPSALEEVFADKLPDAIELVFAEKLPEFVTKQAPKIAVNLAGDGLNVAKQVAGEVQGAITGPGLTAAKTVLQTTYGFMVDVDEDAPELVEFLDKPGFGTTLGPMHMGWTGMYTRAETILGVFDRWIESPPKWSRRDIRELLTSFGPDEIDFDIDVSVNIVVVGSKVLAIGGDVPSIPFPLAVYGLDKLLEAAGVPE